ncbi:MAG: phosphate ABC transporter ATP-binding protein [Methylococcaceae bacterium]|nr:phosphate ABC transporter ATP-binding protein [Methylococcaceae bacterium]
MLNALRIELLRSAAATGVKKDREADPSILPIWVEDLGLFRNGRWLLKHVSFKLQKGSISMILGANGAGKTLLLKCCHGLLPPCHGKVSWREVDFSRLRDSQAMVFQRTVLLKRSVAANIEYGLKLRGLAKKDRLERIDQSLGMAGLETLRNRPAGFLSGGEQQRLALARAWALRPQVLFMDEPTANVDPPATAIIERLIWKLANQGVKIVTSTHDLHQAKRVADEILFLHQGRLLEQTPARDFFEHPKSPEAHAFIHGELPG